MTPFEARFAKNSREEIRVTLSECEGFSLCNLRAWYQPAGGGERLPGKAGLALRVEQLPLLIAALQDAQRAAEGGDNE